MTILRRTHIDLHRREHRRVRPVGFDPSDLEGMLPAAEAGALDPPLADPADRILDDLLDRFEDDAIEDALRGLPEPMRWVLLLLDVEQLGVADTAATLEVPKGTVKSRASRARARLRDALEPLARERGWLPRYDPSAPGG